MWSLGCVFLDLLIWAILGFTSVEKFRSSRHDRRYPGSHDIEIDDAYWQMLQNNEVVLRKPVKDVIQILRDQISKQRNQRFKEILELVIKMLHTVKERRILALDLHDTLDRIYKQTERDLANFGDDYLPDSTDAQEQIPSMLRLSTKAPDRRSHEQTREEAAGTAGPSSNFLGDSLTASPLGLPSPHSPRGSHTRNSLPGDFVGRS